MSHANSDLGPCQRLWAAVNTHAHREHIAREHLLRQDFEVYFPVTRRRRTHARRTDFVLRPLFAGYLFVAIDPEKTRWRPILSTVGVRSIVRFGDRLGTVEQEFIESLRARERDGVIVKPSRVRPPSPYQVGQSIQLNGGPLDGLVATIVRLEEKDRLLVLLDLMQRGVHLRLSADEVMPWRGEGMVARP